MSSYRSRLSPLLSLVLSVALLCACTTNKPHEQYVRDTPVANMPGASAVAGATPNVGESGNDAAANGELAADDERFWRSACGDPPVGNGSFSQQALRAAAAECAVYHYCGFQAAARELETATRTYAGDDSSEQQRSARAAFSRAMRMWSRAELFQFGPAANSSLSAGKDIYQGKGLRDRVYAWPQVSQCRVEEQLVKPPSDASNLLISARGLFGIEYALFYEAADSACSANSATAQTLRELSADDLAQRKREYAALLAADVRAQAEQLSQAWSADGDNFSAQFAAADGYPSEQEAMNVLGWSLIYVEREVKDWKLGLPAGYTASAPVTTGETPFAHISADALRANLRGFRALFQGCAADGGGLGFDDWLHEAGHSELADELVAAYEGAQAGVDSLPQLNEASAAQLDAAYQALRVLTSLLKSDLFGTGSPINLKLPASVEGDTD